MPDPSNDAKALLLDGYNPALVTSRLAREHGLTAAEAARIVSELTGEAPAGRSPLGVLHMSLGAVIVAAGALIFAVSDAGAIDVACLGVVIVGIAQFVAGVKLYQKPIEDPAVDVDVTST